MTETLAPPQAPKQPLPETPFVGLVPYGEDDAAFFFGRDAEKAIITANLRAARLTILYGASGVGKTSVLNAGVVHDLHQQVRANAAGRTERTPFAVCAFSSWRTDPMSALAVAMRAACVEALGGEELPPWQPGAPLLEAVRGWTERVRPLLVVLDQFEEYFLYHPNEHGEGTFTVEFPRLVNELNLRVNFVLSLREDAWAKLDRFEDSIPDLFENYVRVEHLDRWAARQAIEGPVGEWNRRLPPGEEAYGVEPALVEAVIEAAAAGRLGLTEGGDGAGPDAASADAVEAPFLQLVMERLWRATIEAGAHTLDLARLETLGGAQQIVENHLLDALGKLDRDEQAVAADLFRFLVTRSKTKIAHPASDLAEWTGRPEPEVSAVLDKLCRGDSGRILRSISPPSGETAVSYELFHDVLAEPILAWRRGYEQERARRLARRRFARIGGVLLTLVAIFAGLGIWALEQRSTARGQRDLARSRGADLSKLAVSAARQTDDPQLAVQLAASATDADPTSQAARQALRATLLQPGLALLPASFDDYIFLPPLVGPGGRLVATWTVRKGVQLWRVATGISVPIQHYGFGLAFSPDGRMVAIGQQNGYVRLLNAESGKVVAVLKGHHNLVEVAAFSPDGKLLVTGGDDATARLWDIPSGKPAGVLHGSQLVEGVAFSPDGKRLAIRNDRTSIWIFDVATQERQAVLANDEFKSGPFRGISFSPDGRYVVTLRTDYSPRIWDAATGKSILLLPGQRRWAAFSPDGRLVVRKTGATTAVVWDLQARQALSTLRRYDGILTYGASFSPDGRLIVADRAGGGAAIWNAATGKVQAVLGKGTVYSASFSPDGTLVATGSGDGVVRLWQTVGGKLVGAMKRHRGAVLSTAFAAGGRVLVTGSDSDGVRLWDLSSLVPDARLRTHGVLRDLAYGAGGKLAMAYEDGTARVWDATARRIVSVFRGHIESVAFSRDGKLLLTGSGDGTARIRNLTTGTSGVVLHAGAPVRTVGISPDGTLLVTGGDSGATLWRADGHRVRDLAPGTPVERASFSPDGKLVVTAGEGAAAMLWTTDGELVRPVEPFPYRHRQLVSHGAAASPDGRLVLTTAKDANLWTPAGKQVATVQRNSHTAAFSPDGSLILTADADGTLRIRSTATRRVLLVIPPESGPVDRVAFSPDGMRIAAGASSGVVSVYACAACVSQNALRAVALERLSRP